MQPLTVCANFQCGSAGRAYPPITSAAEGGLAAFADGIRERLGPNGELEIFIVDRLISAAWRLRRAVAVETGLFHVQKERPGAMEDRLANMQLLSRSEVMLERSLCKALEKLHYLRRPEQVNDPWAVVRAEM